MDERDRLASEARRLGRYLLGVDPPDELVERYAEADRSLFPGEPDPVDGRVMEFVRRHGWSLPLLEAGVGIARPACVLRRKIVVMAAILETTPRFADRFDAACPGPALAVVRLFGLGLASAFKIAGGLALYALVRTRR